MHGRGDVIDGELHEPSKARQMCLDRVRAIYKEIGAPIASSPAEAFTALCGQRPGYGEAPQMRATFREGR
eukprot:12189412-Heterocapsa_arctica.AAC.1